MGKVRVSTCHDSITDENHAHGMLKLPSRQWQRMHPHKSIQPCVHANRRHSCRHLAAPRCAASQPSIGACALYKNTYTVSKHASSRARVCAHARNISTHNAHRKRTCTEAPCMPVDGAVMQARHGMPSAMHTAAAQTDGPHTHGTRGCHKLA